MCRFCIDIQPILVHVDILSQTRNTFYNNNSHSRIPDLQVRGNNESLENTALSDEESLDYGCVPQKRCNSSPLLGSADVTMGPTSLDSAPLEEVHDFDNGATNENPFDVIRDVPASEDDLKQLTTKQVRRNL